MEDSVFSAFLQGEGQGIPPAGDGEDNTAKLRTHDLCGLVHTLFLSASSAISEVNPSCLANDSVHRVRAVERSEESLFCGAIASSAEVSATR